MKSLRIIQILSKIAWVICKIIFILCIVGASCCLLSLIILPIMKDVVIYENTTFTVLLMEKGTDLPTAITAVAIGLGVCGVSIFLAKYTELFFKKELDLGTPFNKVIVRDMRKLALVHVIASLVMIIAIAITVAIVRHFYPDLPKFNDHYGGSIGFAITMLIISLFCDYGAEKEQQVNTEIKE